MPYSDSFKVKQASFEQKQEVTAERVSVLILFQVVRSCGGGLTIGYLVKPPLGASISLTDVQRQFPNIPCFLKQKCFYQYKT